MMTTGEIPEGLLRAHQLVTAGRRLTCEGGTVSVHHEPMRLALPIYLHAAS
jgi:hypothetical protein